MGWCRDERRSRSFELMLRARAFGARQLVKLGGHDPQRHAEGHQPVVCAEVAGESRVPAIHQLQDMVHSPT